MLLDELAHTNFMYNDTFTNATFANEQSFEDLYVDKLRLIHELEGPTHFTIHDLLDHGVLFTFYDISTYILDANDYLNIYI